MLTRDAQIANRSCAKLLCYYDYLRFWNSAGLPQHLSSALIRLRKSLICSLEPVKTKRSDSTKVCGTASLLIFKYSLILSSSMTCNVRFGEKDGTFRTR